MEKKEVVIDNPVAVAGVTLLPVVKVWLKHRHSNGRISFLGVKQPVGVIVVSQSAKRAFRVTGEEVPPDQLMQEVSGTNQSTA